MVPHVAAGRLKALAITGSRQPPALPSVLTLSESGVPFETVHWHAVFRPPRGTSEPIVERLNTVFVRAVDQPDV